MATGDLTIKWNDKDQPDSYGEGADVNKQLTLTDAEVSGSRDNTVRHGLTSNEPQKLLAGNQTFTASFEGDVSAEMGEALDRVYNDLIGGGEFHAEGQLTVSFTALKWNSFSVSISEDDDIASVSFEADLVVDTVNHPNDT